MMTEQAKTKPCPDCAHTEHPGLYWGGAPWDASPCQTCDGLKTVPDAPLLGVTVVTTPKPGHWTPTVLGEGRTSEELAADFQAASEKAVSPRRDLPPTGYSIVVDHHCASWRTPYPGGDFSAAVDWKHGCTSFDEALAETWAHFEAKARLQ